MVLILKFTENFPEKFTGKFTGLQIHRKILVKIKIIAITITSLIRLTNFANIFEFRLVYVNIFLVIIF